MRSQDPKSGRWSTKGTIIVVISNEGAQTPSSYLIEADNGGLFLQNGRYICLQSQQPADSTAEEPDENSQQTDIEGDVGVELLEPGCHSS